MIRTQNNNQTVHRRFMRRVAPLIILACALLGLGGSLNIRSGAFEKLRTNHLMTMTDLENQIEAELQDAAASLVALAGETVVSGLAVADIDLLPSNQGLRDSVTVRFLDWMTEHTTDFTQLRYVNMRGQVLVEVANTTRGTEIVPRSDNAALPDALYQSAAGAELGEVFMLSPYSVEAIIGEQSRPYFILSTPVYGAEIFSSESGVLQVYMDAYQLLNTIVSANTWLRGSDGRRMLLLNNSNQYLIDTANNDMASLFVNATGAGRESVPLVVEGQVESLSEQQLSQFFNETSISVELVNVGNQLVSTRTVTFLEAPDMPWRLALIDDPNQAFADSNRTSWMVLAFSVAVGFVVVFGLSRILRHMLRPFERAAALAHQATHPDGQAEPAQPVDTDDALTQSIVAMSDRITSLTAEMENQRERLKGNLEIAARVSRETTIESDVDALMNRVVQLICAEKQFHQANIFMLDEVGQDAVLAYSYAESGQVLVRQGVKVPVRGDATAISLVVNHRRSYVDHGPDPAGSGGLVVPETRSRLLVPLFAGEAVQGVLDIQSPETNVFQEEELQAFELLADQVGIAIYNIRLLQETEQRVEQIVSLSRELTRDAWEGVEEKFQVEQAYHYDLREVKSGPAAPLVDDSISMPITVRGHVVGSLDVAAPEGVNFTRDEQLILQAVTDRVALAIDRARLFQETQLSLSETSLLYNLSRHINEATALEEIIQAIIASVMPDAFGGQIMMFDDFLADNVPGSLTVTADWYAPDTPRAQDSLMGLRLHLAEHNLANGLRSDEVLMISDIEADVEIDDYVRGVLQSIGARGLVIIPLTIRGQWRGSIAIEFPEPRRFAAKDRRIFTALIDQASVAIDNSLLLRQTETALEEASRLYAASRALATSSGPHDILRALVDHLLYEDVNQVFIVLLTTPGWDVPDASAVVVASWSADEAGLDLEGITFDPTQFPAWSILASPELLVIGDVEADEGLDDLERVGLQSLEARSVSILPLRAANRTIGAIWIGSGQPSSYNERDLRIYQSFSEQVSISLEASRLYEQLERRAAQLQTSAQVSQFASSILDLNELLPRLVDLIKSAFHYDHVQVFLMDREDRFAELWASTGEAGQQLLAIRHRLEKGSVSVIGAVTAENRPVVAADTGMADVVHKPNPYLPHTRSEMALPLVVKGKVVGALDVQSNRPNAFTDEDVTVLTTLAAQISVAIDNARLFEQAEHRASDMSLLFAVTSAAASAESLTGALQNVVDDLQTSLNPLSVGVFMAVDYLDEISGSTLTRMRIAAAAGIAPSARIPEVKVGDAGNVIGIAAESLRSKIINKVADDPLYMPLVAEAQSAVVVPLTSASKIVAMIVMENAQPFAYSHETLTLLQTMGGTLTALIQNQQLLEQLQQTNEQLLEIDRVKSEFLANMSHELRTPLNSIIGFSRVILKGIDGPLTEMQEQDLSTIYNSGQHLLNLINDLLDQAKIAAGKMEIKSEYFDIKPVVEGVRSIGIGLVKDKPIEIKIDVESGLPQVYGDEIRTRQVLLNLLSNAAKFTQQGSITVCAYRSQHSETGAPVVRVDVVDTGIGIAEKDIPLLFEAFRQVDSSLTRTAGGTGLGLPISKSLIELQGGEMFVHSQVNAGSTFSVTIPLESTEKVKGGTGPLIETVEEVDTILDAVDTDTWKLSNGNGQQPEDPQKPAEPVEPASTRTAVFPAVTTTKRQVLIIEDNPDRVDQYRRIIQRQGFDVYSASIPLEAEAMASGLRPSVIIMDVNFAGGAGWDILRNLKERDDTFDIPIIVVTLDNEEQRALDAGAFTFLQHPITPEDLLGALREAESDSNTERILIIDDQPESTRLLKQLLDEHGRYRVFAAHNGVEGVSMVARRRPNLVILDLRMPEKDGFEVLQELRSNPETSNIPVLIVTGDTLDASEQDQLAGVEVVLKTDISLEDCQRFLTDVQMHLSRNGE